MIFTPPYNQILGVLSIPRAKSNYTPREKKEDRKFCCILYPDSTEYDCDLLLNRLSSFWQKFWYIRHNRDTYHETDYDLYVLQNGKEPEWKIGDLKKPHYHVVAYVDAPCLLGRAAKKFGIPSNDVQECRNLKSSVRYLIHKDHPYKYQYEMEEIITNDPDSLPTILKDQLDATEKAKILFDYIQSSACTSITQLSSFAIQTKTWDELRRGQHLYTALFYERQKEIYNASQKEKFENEYSDRRPQEN